MTDKTETTDPAEIVASVIAGPHKNVDGTPMIGRATRKKAQEVLNALRAAGWRILR